MQKNIERDYKIYKVIMVLFFAHRINSSTQLKTIPRQHGIELDLRDFRNELILEHDPFKGGELFENYLKEYKHSGIILNIKSERIEIRVLELLKKYGITNYFFLDSSFPMIYHLNKHYDEQNIAIRFSEYELIESVLRVKDMVKWVWVDCFTRFPLTPTTYKQIKDAGLKICLVSPELQGHLNSKEMITQIKEEIKRNGYEIDGICTKEYNIRLWK